MSKVVLTKEQAEAIEKIKKDVKGGITYGNIEAQLHKRWTCPTFKSLNTLNIKEYLDALYIGYKIEPEYVSFEKAMKAHREGKTVYFHRKGNFNDKLTATEMHWSISSTRLRDFSLLELFEGKWSIEQ